LITKSLFKVTVGAETFVTYQVEASNEAEAKDMIQDHLRARAGESAGAVLVLEEDYREPQILDVFKTTPWKIEEEDTTPTGVAA
jgi:hypothetical protein